MIVAEFLFIVILLVAVMLLMVAAFFAFDGRLITAYKILRAVVIGLVAYLAVVVFASACMPRRTLQIGERRCFDDFCIAVDSVGTTPMGDQIIYSVNLILSSKAAAKAQREKNLVVYLADGVGKRYNPANGELTKPSAILLEPKSFSLLTETFVVPKVASNMGVVIAHEGGFPVRYLIIGEESWFRKATVVPLRARLTSGREFLRSQQHAGP